MQQNNQTYPKIKALGSVVHLVTFDQINQNLQNWIETGKNCKMVLVTGFHGLYRASTDPYYKKVSQTADLWVSDGIAPVLLAKLKGNKNIHRTPGAQIMTHFFEMANEEGFSSYFYGDTDDTLGKLKAILEKKYPGHTVKGVYSPPFRKLDEVENERIIENINASNPDIVWVGLGLPKQDIWAYKNKDKLNAKVVIGVGAAFGFLAGNVSRCPDWIGNNGMEWAFRLLVEPKKIWKRVLLEAPIFLFNILMEKMHIKKY